MVKIIYFLSHPIQYQSPLLKLLAKEDGFNLSVCYFTGHTIGGEDRQFGRKIKWDVPLFEGYQYKFLKNFSPRPAVSGKFWGLINWGIVGYLLSEKPDIILVHGWGYFSNLLLLGTAKLLNIKVLMRAESPLKQDKKSFFKRILLKYFVHKCLFIGEQNKRFYFQYGVPPSKLFFTPYSVDNQRFAADYRKLSDKASVRKQLGIPDSKIVILFSGKYIDKKRPIDLLKAFWKMDKPDTHLIMLGEGILRNEMESFIRDSRINDRVRLVGFVNQTEISKFYRAADIFVLPSGKGETWGLALNEAMNFHLPLIVSDMVGSTDDLVHEGENGFTFPVGDVDALAEKMKILVDDEILRKKMGDKSAGIVENYSYQNIISGIKQAIF